MRATYQYLRRQSYRQRLLSNSSFWSIATWAGTTIISPETLLVGPLISVEEAMTSAQYGPVCIGAHIHGIAVCLPNAAITRLTW